MNYRGVMLVARVAAGALLGAVISCSAPDPGQVTYRDREGSGAVPAPTATATGTSTPGTDSGSGAGTATGAFVGAAPFVAGTASGSKNGNHAFAGAPDPQNPAGEDCTKSTCHGGATGSIWGFAGTVYTDGAGATPVAGAQVRVVDAAGVQVGEMVYTDALGNFWTSAPAPPLPAGAKVGVRNATKSLTMSASAATGCQAVGCHVATGGAGRIFLN